MGREEMVRLKFEPFDDGSRHWVPVIDEDTGKQVGSIHSYGTGPDCFGGTDISLFNGKYRARVNRYEAAVGFVIGVETIVNHMTSHEDRPGPTSAGILT
jgi:hypothetical protein